MAHDIFKIPNLVTLGRLLLLIPTAYFLSQSGPNDRYYALGFLIAAGFSDFLDGFLARLLDQRTRLGLILDPLSDKILAGTLVVLLIIYRDFPLWLAAVIIGRDLLIMIGGLAIKSKISEVPASNLSGKYSFTATAVLLASYVIEYNFGIWLFTFFAIAFVILSLIMYGRVMYKVSRGHPMPRFHDKLSYRVVRVVLVWIVSGYFLYRLGQFLGWL